MCDLLLLTMFDETYIIAFFYISKKTMMNVPYGANIPCNAALRAKCNVNLPSLRCRFLTYCKILCVNSQGLSRSKLLQS